MKPTIIITVMALAFANALELYDKDLDIDGDAVFSDPEGLRSHLDCFLDRSPCEPIPAKIKSVIPEMIALSCTRCTNIQKHNIKKLFQVMPPEDYKAALQKYDPNGQLMHKLIEIVAAY